MPVTNAKGMVNIVSFDISVQKLKLMAVKYHNDPKFWDRHVSANSADPDQTELHFAIHSASFADISLQ